MICEAINQLKSMGVVTAVAEVSKALCIAAQMQLIPYRIACDQAGDDIVMNVFVMSQVAGSEENPLVFQHNVTSPLKSKINLKKTNHVLNERK